MFNMRIIHNGQNLLLELNYDFHVNTTYELLSMKLQAIVDCFF